MDIIISRDDKFTLEKITDVSELCGICLESTNELFHLYNTDECHEVFNIGMCQNCYNRLRNIINKT